MQTNHKPTPLRVVHLLGGAQAVDFDEENVDVGLDGLPHFLLFKRPAYPALYADLERRGLQPVGVRIMHDAKDGNGVSAVNWHAWKTPVGLHGREIIQDWSNVRRSELARADKTVREVAGKIRAYLRLVNFRLYQLSQAYHDMLRMQICGQGLSGDQVLFSNLWSLHVDAAIHAYLADAASLRDALAEALWHLIMKEASPDVSSIGQFLKRAKHATHPLALEIIREADDGGWIKNLSDIRNDVIHVVPVATRQEFRLSEIRTRTLVGDKTIPVLHNPLTDDRGRLPARLPAVADYSDETAVNVALKEYGEFSAKSGDALEYAWRTTSHLMKLAEDVRVAAALKGEMLTLTDADLAL